MLFICTGNICRSPMAEALLRDRLSRRGVEATVHSTGLSFEGRAATEHTAAVLAERGIDVSAHRSSELSADLLTRADLVIGLTRMHVREAVILETSAWPRTFTLKELVRRAEASGRRAAEQPFDEWLQKVAAGRTPEDIVGWDDADDVADPFSLSRETYESTCAEIEELIDRMVALAWETGVIDDDGKPARMVAPPDAGAGLPAEAE